MKHGYSTKKQLLNPVHLLSQDFVNWVCGNEIYAPLLALLLRAARRYILKIAEGAIHKTVYMPAVEAFRICIPPVEQQFSLALTLQSQMDAAEEALRRLQDQLRVLEQLPSALLREAFSGRL